MLVNQERLIQIHSQIANCTDCKQAFKAEAFTVSCPPGEIYPTPPAEVKLLFVGVAPPSPGKHFYSDPNDGLKHGLFSILN